MNRDCVVVGIGSPYRQDDAAGWVVIERLEQEGVPCRTERAATAGFEVMDKIRGHNRAIIVDACLLGRAPGSILEVSGEDIFSLSAPIHSHAIPLGDILNTGRMCFPEEMPADIRIILIQVKELNPFTRKMSPEVEAAISEVVALIKTRISATGYPAHFQEYFAAEALPRRKKR